MSDKTLMNSWAKESLAMLMIGDALLTLIDSERHVRLWMKGPRGWRNFLKTFLNHRAMTAGLALGELGLGVWLAERQTPDSLTRDTSETQA